MAGRAAKGETRPAVRHHEAPALDSLIGYHLRRASLADLSGVSAALADVNIRPVPLSVFAMIVEHPGIAAAEICRQLAIQRANIVSILADLETRGLFVRETDPQDQRVQRLYATTEGRATYTDWLDRVRAHEEHLLRHFSDAERDTLRTLLEKVWRDA